MRVPSANFRRIAPGKNDANRYFACFAAVASFCSVLFVHSIVLGQEAKDRAAEEFFEAKVRPILANRCFECHGEQKQESDLRLDVRASILEGGASGDPAARVGDSKSSMLLRYVRHEEPGMEMPPEESLSAEEIAILERWVRNGMAWGSDATAAITTMEDRLEHEYQHHWSFQAPSVQSVDSSTWSATLRDWPQNRVDNYVAANLHKAGFEPSSLADKRTLIRRLKFDLLGLPPTLEEVNQFLTDTSPSAYAQLVESYLASPNYGERWGRHWLDVARYADTRGYTFANADRNYPWSYTYRDYVLESHNDDKPFDQFVLEQLAADQLELGGDNRALRGLGFLTVGRKFNNIFDDIDEQIDAVTRGFMGLTIACARCHDHKYDAIPTEDYYSLFGVFVSTHEPKQLPLIGDEKTLPELKHYEALEQSSQGKLTQLENSLVNSLTDHARARIGDYLAEAAGIGTNTDLRPHLSKKWKSLLANKAKPDSPTLMPWYRLIKKAPKLDKSEFKSLSDQLIAELRSGKHEFLNPILRDSLLNHPPNDRSELVGAYAQILEAVLKTWKDSGANDAARKKQSAEVRQLLWYYFDNNSPAKIRRDQLEQYLSPSEKKQRQELITERNEIRKQKPANFHRAMAVEDRKTVRDAPVLIRGSAGRHGEIAPRRSPRLISREQPKYTQGSGRLELANDIVSPTNPLTARVIVNRVWMHHFGRPLVETPSDFGIRCPKPVQSELLDYLASFLVDHNWSIKSLHREILFSSTYQQSSQRREDYEKQDPENSLLWRMNRRRLEFESLRDSLLFVSGKLNSYFGGKSQKMFLVADKGLRRSVYGYLDRQDLPNLLRVFDFAGPDQSVAERSKTTVPQQALYLLNSPLMQSLSQTTPGLTNLNDGEFVERIYGQILARAPSETERTIGAEFLANESSKAEELTRRQQLAQILLMSNEFCHVD